MVHARRVKDESGRMYLCETYTDDDTKVLKQVETDRVYGQSVVDIIAGYMFKTPYSRFTYVEVDKPEEPIESPEEPTESVV